VDEVRLLQVLDEAVRAVRGALDGLDDWGPAGDPPGQYHLDLAADAAALPILHGAGLAVLSEESGRPAMPAAPLLAVIDPIDGSTNAHRGMPFYATSICVLDAEGPLVGVVVNQATGTRFAAVRGGRGRAMAGHRPFGCTDLSSAIVGISGFPGSTRVGPSSGPWARPPWSSAPWPRACSTPIHGGRDGARSSGGTTWPGCSSAARPAR
jgi:myo-inositol-1(or 4)-monophosphatase